MPYSKSRYGTKTQFRKMTRCVKKVSAQGKKYNPYAVCRASIYRKPTDKSDGLAWMRWGWHKAKTKVR